MPARDRKASTIDLAADLSTLTPERATEFLAASLEADTRSGVLRLSRVPSVIARAYGPSKKPVCHFLTGWIAGLGRSLLERDVLCEESACAAQGRDRCEFELRPMGPP